MVDDIFLFLFAAVNDRKCSYCIIPLGDLFQSMKFLFESKGLEPNTNLSWLNVAINTLKTMMLKLKLMTFPGPGKIIVEFVAALLSNKIRGASTKSNNMVEDHGRLERKYKLQGHYCIKNV
jgi:hypothetical protein